MSTNGWRWSQCINTIISDHDSEIKNWFFLDFSLRGDLLKSEKAPIEMCAGWMDENLVGGSKVLRNAMKPHKMCHLMHGNTLSDLRKEDRGDERNPFKDLYTHHVCSFH